MKLKGLNHLIRSTWVLYFAQTGLIVLEKNVLKADLSIGPGIHAHSHILGRFKQEHDGSTDYRWIIVLEVTPGLKK